MTYENKIDKRRLFVKDLMNKGIEKKSIIKTARIKFDACYSTIISDIISIENANLPYGCNSARGIKLLVLKRDNFMCQYCTFFSNSSICVEHVVPNIFKNGVNESFNLVCACQSCNCIKKQNVWIPRNIELITKNNLDHREYIFKNAVKDCRI